MAIFTKVFRSNDVQHISIDIESQQILKYDAIHNIAAETDNDEKMDEKIDNAKNGNTMISVYEQDDSLHLVIPHSVSHLFNNGNKTGAHQIIIETEDSDGSVAARKTSTRLSLEILLDLAIILTALLFLQALYMGYKTGLLFKLI